MNADVDRQSDLSGRKHSPLFSVCVPQYNRTSFLIEACRNLAQQTFKDFELCISDDCSTDGRSQELETFLHDSSLRFVYKKNEKNLRYDGNLRSAISLAGGRYCVLMGNDDCFAHASFLENVTKFLLSNPNVGVALTNYIEYAGGRIYKRVRGTRVVSGGPKVASTCFRNFSFVSGVILRTDRAQAHATGKWDGSEMYQMYLSCRIIAEGFDLLELDQPAIRKGILIPGESVDCYSTKPQIKPCPIVERLIPLSEMGRLVYDAVRPYAGHKKISLGIKIFSQILVFTYPFWIFEYRRVQSWKYALGICLGMRPRNLFRQLELPLPGALLLRTIYFVVSCASLLIPIRIFDACRPRLHDLAKSLFQPA